LIVQASKAVSASRGEQDQADRQRVPIWFDTLEPRAAAKVATAYAKIERGDVGKLEPVGAGVLEFKISYGPGYRVYLAYDGTKLVILLGGGDKTSQDGDIKDARGYGPSTSAGKLAPRGKRPKRRAGKRRRGDGWR
jgi:putative addiction module killer protein